MIVLIVLGWIFAAAAALLLLVYVLILIDAALSRPFMSSSVDFSVERLREGDGTRVLIIYLPGILARCHQQLPAIKAALLDGVDGGQVDLWSVDYLSELFRWKYVCQRIVQWVTLGHPDYDKIVFVGASLGGRLLNAVYQYLPKGEMGEKLRRPIIIDAPFDRRSFAMGGDMLALVLRFVPVGLLLNMLRLPDRLAQPPEDENIGNAADFSLVSGGVATTYKSHIAWVKAQAVIGLSGHKFSTQRDQLVAMSTMPWFAHAFDGRSPLFIACTEKETQWQTFEEPVTELTDRDGNKPIPCPVNKTVKQFASLGEFRRRLPGLTVWVVRSTHCGYLERPVAWHAAISAAVREVTTN